jgi:hypothetical protein
MLIALLATFILVPFLVHLHCTADNHKYTFLPLMSNFHLVLSMCMKGISFFSFLTDYHVPALSKNAQESLEKYDYHLQSLPKPYQSCNIVEKIGDGLTSHSDSRGGGVSSRF